MHEKSPYLLQHAHNPVAWHPWGDEAFAEALRRDVPVFLSIGYSTCHWCHVMERESFEDAEVAGLLNGSFVSIKVDREERPDIDHFYMSACTAMTGRGGWPLSCFLTPDKKPFFAGSYFPKNDRYGMRGFMAILGTLADLWQQDRPRLLAASDDITRHVSEIKAGPQEACDETASHRAYQQLEGSFDAKYGGFGGAPKFPSAHNLLFLIRYHLLYKNRQAVDMVAATLQAMQRGGIWDHIGGGFSRYSTDEQWLVPHFEKMMYDNAMLTIACCEAGAAIDESFFATARRILDYCFREMTDAGGGFYTAQDADSEGEEGRYYVFTPSEVRKVLGTEDGRRFCKIFDITPQGNFESKSIPNLLYSNPSAEDAAFAEKCFPVLRQYREKRVPPLKDDKMLAAVNGLMLAALSTAGRLTGNADFIAAAEKTGRFILDRMFAGPRLHASLRDGSLRHPATSDDYAYVLWGLFELYQATLQPSWLVECLRIAESMLALFQDEQGGCLYLSGLDVPDLPVRGKNTHDGALPSGNAVAAQVLARLAGITCNDVFSRAAASILQSQASGINAYPAAYTGLLCAELYNRHGGTNIVLASGSGLDELLRAAQGFNPFATLALCGSSNDDMTVIAPLTKNRISLEGKAAAYICTPGSCLPPVTDPAVLARHIALP
ncbi:MAG: thioredoxin domain-containing protein [Proteobacteria bacterium]|nr:thioredoxin domain-containing protein [Pseudomonadota bacterium]